MDLKHKAAGELAEMGAWSRDSLIYAREYGQRQLVWQLKPSGPKPSWKTCCSPYRQEST